MLKNNLTVINIVINQPFVYILSRKYILHLQYECCKTMQMAFFVNVYKNILKKHCLVRNTMTMLTYVE